MSEGHTTVNIELLCVTANCTMTKQGSAVASMMSACGLAAKHRNRTGHETLARLIQETSYS